MDDLFGVAHLVDRLVAAALADRQKTPVLLHFRVQKVLIDAHQFCGEDLVQQIDDLLVALHVRLAPLPPSMNRPTVAPLCATVTRHAVVHATDIASIEQNEAQRKGPEIKRRGELVQAAVLTRASGSRRTDEGPALLGPPSIISAIVLRHDPQRDPAPVHAMTSAIEQAPSSTTSRIA